MFIVTADIFSGRTNPSWLVDGPEAQAVLRELALNPEALVTQELGAEAGLGYRGLVIELQSDTSAEEYHLPQSFRINTGLTPAEQKGQEIAERLIHGMLSQPSMIETALDTSVQQVLLENITTPAIQVGPVTVPEQEPQPEREEPTPEVTCTIELGRFNPGFWNDPSVVRVNNCYNYASNRRTGTFAQPGRACGNQFREITCAEVGRGAMCDGARARFNCVPDQEAPRWFMALVVTPNLAGVGAEARQDREIIQRDYHWYRKQQEGFWGHKPGSTPARNTDNSGRVIWNPETADRGPYTVFCGYFYARSPMVVR